MTWNLETARARIGLLPDDTAQDANLTTAMAVALATAESYCDRRFMLKADEQEFTAPINCNLLVRRYPLVSMATLAPLDPQPDPPADPMPVPATWRMDKKRGIVFIVGVPPWAIGGIAPVGSTPPPSAFGSGARAGFVLAYTGGYDPLPDDLEAALWMVFDSVWSQTPGYGVAAGQQGTAPIKSFGIDGMSISYDAPGSAARLNRAEAYGLLPSTAIGILDFYRAESAALGG